MAAMLPAGWYLWNHRSSFVDDGENISDAKLWKRLAPFALWLWLANIFSNLFEASDRYMLIHWSQEAAEVAIGTVGQYHSGRVVPLLLVSVATVLAGIIMPYFSAAWEAGDKQKVHRQVNWATKSVLLMFVFGGWLVLLAAPLLFESIFQGRYNDGLAVLPLTLVYCTYYSAFLVAQEYLWVREKGGIAFGIVAVALTGNILLNMALIPTLGLWGAVMATTAANASTLFFILIANHIAGCKTEVGLWCCSFLPALLLLPSELGVASLLAIIWICLKTSWIISPTERQEFDKLIDAGKRRIGFGSHEKP